MHIYRGLEMLEVFFSRKFCVRTKWIVSYAGVNVSTIFMENLQNLMLSRYKILHFLYKQRK